MSVDAPDEPPLQLLHDATRRLMAATTAQEVCETAVATARDILDMPITAVWLHDADENVLRRWATTDRCLELFGEQVVYRPGNSLSWEVFEEGELRTYSDVTAEPGVYNDETPIRSEIILPLGEYGVMNVGSLEPDDFTEADVRLARILAANTEAAIERAERERRLRVQNDRLEEFVRVVSHDLRNPLSVAAGYLEVGMDACDGGTEPLEKVEAAIERMETLIDDLLALARQGNVVDDPRAVDLGTLAQRAWANVQAEDATLDVEASMAVFGDPDRLRQVFENLFRNAVEHGGETVTVRVGTLADGAGFYVADDGPGIPPAQRDRVFESGYSTNDDGTGFGLAIIVRIVEAHGWSIDVTGSDAGGARFEVTGDARPVVPLAAS